MLLNERIYYETTVSERIDSLRYNVNLEAGIHDGDGLEPCGCQAYVGEEAFTRLACVPCASLQLRNVIAIIMKTIAPGRLVAKLYELRPRDFRLSEDLN